MALSLIAGENPTYLNVRYDITFIQIKEAGKESDKIIEREMQFLRLINQKYRKSSKSWSTRQQLIQALSYVQSKQLEQTQQLIKKEVDLLDICNIHEPRNYYVWQHRKFILKLAKTIMPSGDLVGLINSEKLKFSEGKPDASAQEYIDWLSHQFA
ncbi:hypothetical protein FGO68_gene16035 [Halteria grandinella]|uniref:Protein prenyltransferase alpha subunit n=1 Tax=Halteria grandinella TaxID=5974 RepID=A0A8J8T8M1_HALGN|nr:hypothetical protein FGO68_gene16035 [Halteria grandinella]